MTIKINIDLALRMRKRILEASLESGTSTHLGGGLSIVEIVASLYGSVLKHNPKDPSWDQRDRFILSKGHGVLGFFSALVETGYFDDEVFSTFMKNESDLIAHPILNLELGIESSNGSLGQGLSLGVGMSWAAKFKQESHRVFVLMGDGECNEGSVWEAAMSGAQFRLNNLTAIVDANGFQSDGSTLTVIDSQALPEKFKAFGWDVRVVNGHNPEELEAVLSEPNQTDKPRAVIANTIKGKGVSFMEGNNSWHHNRLTQNSFDLAMKELVEVLS